MIVVIALVALRGVAVVSSSGWGRWGRWARWLVDCLTGPVVAWHTYDDDKPSNPHPQPTDGNRNRNPHPNWQMAVHYNGRTVAISSIHVGVDNAHLRGVMAEPQVQG